MTNIEKIHDKAELIYNTIVKVAIDVYHIKCAKDESIIYRYSKDRKIGIDIGFFDEGWRTNKEGKRELCLGHANYTIVGNIYLNLAHFANNSVPVSEKLKVIRHELGHVREMRLHNDFSEEAAIKYE